MSTRTHIPQTIPIGSPPQRDKSMRIYVVGSLTVEAFGAVLHERSLPGGQGRVMLGMLAVEHDRPLSREQIADELSPEGLPRSWETASPAVWSNLEAALALDLSRERLHERLIQAGLLAGARAAAAHAYRRCHELFARELRVAPTATTLALMRQAAPTA